MTGPQFVTEFDPQYGEMVDVSPLLRRLVCENPSKYTFHGTGTYIIGHGDVAVVDPGPRNDQHVQNLLRLLDGETVRHILITHTHGDHSPAAKALSAATGAPVLGFGPHPTNAAAEDSTTEAETDSDHRPDVEFVPDSALAHGDIVEGPTYTIEALHTPGHISNHLCFALAAEQAVLSGDHVMGWSTTIIPPPDGDVAAYLSSLQLLLDRPNDSRLYPTHGAPIEQHHHFVRALMVHRQGREHAIIEQLSNGPKSAAEIVAVLYADVRKELHKPAARSVLAHLAKLAIEDTVEVAVAGDSPLSSKTVWVRR